MRAVLTRVKSASESVDGKTIGSIGPGFLILLGITHDDTEAQAVKLADKLTGLRIIEDEDGKMNRGLDTVNGEILVISQFTLYGNCRKGRRPSFSHAGDPAWSREMFDRYGVDGVMIGRATYGRPWIFREVKHSLSTGEALPQPTVAERVAIAKEHLQKSLEIKGDHVGILEMRRHMTNYFKGLPDFKSTRLKLVTSLDTAELFATLDEIACRWGGYDLSEAVPAPLSHNL